jgi:hypothetical protein
MLVAGDAHVACAVDITPAQGYTWPHVTAAAVATAAESATAAAAVITVKAASAAMYT